MGRRSTGGSAPPPPATTPSKQLDEDDPSSRPFKSPEYFAAVQAKRKKWRSAKQILADPASAPFLAMSAPPSLRPHPAEYCDVTGLIAKYTDPKTCLKYYSAPVYQYIRSLGPNAVQAILALRNANVEI
jgi:INO80 complex subunit C